MYGALTGMSKLMVGQKHGQAQLKAWRRSYATRPPQVSSFSSDYPGNDDRWNLVVWEEKNGWWSEDTFHTKDDAIQDDMIMFNVISHDKIYMITYMWPVTMCAGWYISSFTFPSHLYEVLKRTQNKRADSHSHALTQTHTDAHGNTQTHTYAHTDVCANTNTNTRIH